MAKKCGTFLYLCALFIPVFFVAQATENFAYLRDMINEQMRAKKEEIENRFSHKRSKIMGDAAVVFATATITGLSSADAIIRLVNQGYNYRDIAAACLGGIATPWLFFQMISSVRQLRQLDVEKCELLDQLDEQVNELRREINKQAKQAREATKKQVKNAAPAIKADTHEEAAEEVESSVVDADIAV